MAANTLELSTAATSETSPVIFAIFASDSTGSRRADVPLRVLELDSTSKAPSTIGERGELSRELPLSFIALGGEVLALEAELGIELAVDLGLSSSTALPPTWSSSFPSSLSPRAETVGRKASSIPVVVTPINFDATLEMKIFHATENLV